MGRPNVGKSTFFNRIVGSRRAIVGDEPGITRDRLYARAQWNGREFRVIDTGGIIPDDKELISAEIYRQARVALEEADLVVMVVDGRSELAAPDIDLARLLLRSGKPLFLAVNKIDSPKLEASAEEFRRLGIKDVFPVSAEHGNGIGDLLDAALERMPKTALPEELPSEAEGPEVAPETSKLSAETKIAIIGRPNVGKSTLLNQLTGSSRAIVSPIAGTTRDAVDELVERGDERYRFIDTAGIRRKGKTKLMAEKLSVVMARKHLEAADVALLVIDAVEGVTALDATIGGYAHESGRSVVIVVNKWDLVGSRRADDHQPADQALYEKQIRSALKFLAYAPVLFVSAASGKNIDRVFSTVQRVARERRKRISTGEMNRFLKSVDFERASSPKADLRIQYMTQAAVAPPTFVVFTNRQGKLHFSYQRFLENQIRRAFGFEGTPIWIKTRGKESG
ncbi:MAG TPA: ribosome biogenesis GTPase Der [Terriglobales bacterium]|nr:ribosome biogenesis GTPase Der [Terriglobales bacterium]